MGDDRKGERGKHRERDIDEEILKNKGKKQARDKERKMKEDRERRERERGSKRMG
jgi:hypothetical protein